MRRIRFSSSRWHARRHVHAEQAGNLSNMFRRRAAATADNPRALLDAAHHLLGIIRRVAVVICPSFLDVRIARVGHGAERLIPNIQRRQQAANMICAADAVQTDGIHRAAQAHTDFS